MVPQHGNVFSTSNVDRFLMLNEALNLNDQQMGRTYLLTFFDLNTLFIRKKAHLLNNIC